MGRLIFEQHSRRQTASTPLRGKSVEHCGISVLRIPSPTISITVLRRSRLRERSGCSECFAVWSLLTAVRSACHVGAGSSGQFGGRERLPRAVRNSLVPYRARRARATSSVLSWPMLKWLLHTNSPSRSGRNDERCASEGKKRAEQGSECSCHGMVASRGNRNAPR